MLQVPARSRPYFALQALLLQFFASKKSATQRQKISKPRRDEWHSIIGADAAQASMGNPRSHHALQNALPVADIVAHFGSAEPKEIAKEVSRLGQRDLQVGQAIGLCRTPAGGRRPSRDVERLFGHVQARFRVVYGTQTFSNNNTWLRRKLLEGAGWDRPRQLASSQELGLCPCHLSALALALARHELGPILLLFGRKTACRASWRSWAVGISDWAP